LGMLFL